MYFNQQFRERDGFNLSYEHTIPRNVISLIWITDVSVLKVLGTFGGKAPRVGLLDVSDTNMSPGLPGTWGWCER